MEQPPFTTPSFTEKTSRVADDSGFEMHVRDISLRYAGIRWGKYINPSERVITCHAQQERVVSHFQILGSDASPDQCGLKETQFVVYRESAEPYEQRIISTHKAAYSFFELMLDNAFFDSLISGESIFLSYFDRHKQLNAFLPACISHMTPQMSALIGDMQRAPYHGSLKGLYLETKLMELFLLQIDALDNSTPASAPEQASTLRPGDVERLTYIKAYIETHFAESMSMKDLAREAGINPTKLKHGFKAFFKTTVFGYVTGLRLEEAKRLLLEDKMPVQEVAYAVGYSYPHYFSAAFKKRFGILPKNVKALIPSSNFLQGSSRRP